jgi:hypothetical protein
MNCYGDPTASISEVLTPRCISKVALNCSIMLRAFSLRNALWHRRSPRESKGGADVRLPSASHSLLRSLLDVLDNQREEEQKRDTAKEHRSSLFGLA